MWHAICEKGEIKQASDSKDRLEGIFKASHILRRHAVSFQNERDKGIKILICFIIKPSIFKIIMSNVKLVLEVLGFHGKPPHCDQGCIML
jgi:hypothetical protein